MSRMLEALKQIESLSHELPLRVDEAAEVSQPVEEREAVAEPVDLSAAVEIAVSVAPASESMVVAMPPIILPVEPILETPAMPEPRVDLKRPVHDRHYVELAENVLGQMPPDGRAALLFVGAEPGRVELKVLGSLAAVLAEQIAGEVLLVDCDIRREESAEFSGVSTPRHPGLAEVLAGAVQWREAVVGTQVKGVGLLPGSRLPQGLPPEQLEKSDTSGLVAELRKRYQLVLFAGTQPDDPLIARLTACCDGTYLLVRLGETHRRTAARSIRSLQRRGGRLLGSIVTGG